MKKKDKIPPCPCNKRKKVAGGMDMCYAIGCCELGDMPCACWICQNNDNGICKRKTEKTGDKKENAK